VTTAVESIEREERRFRIRWGTLLLAVPLLLWLFLLLVFPHVRLFVMSLYRRGGETLTGYNYVSMLQPDSLFLRVFRQTISYSLLNTFLTLLVAYPVAFFIAKVAKGAWKAIVLLLCTLPYWVSELVRVYAWMNILRESGFLNYLLVDVLHVLPQPQEFLFNNWSLFVVFVYSSVLLMLLPIYSSLEGLADEQIQAAQDLGAGWLSTLRYVVLPASMPGVVSGSILVFMLSAGNYLIPNLIGGKNLLWVTEMIYNRFIISTNWNLGSAYSFILLLATAFIVWLGLRLTGQDLRRVFE
jgi:spermidine/putrescine transport system permease protein